MSRTDRIKTLLAPLNPTHLEIKNQSHLHAGHAGDDGTGETHYKIIIAAKSLDELSKIKAHQQIMKLLDPEFKSGLHALSIKIA